MSRAFVKESTGELDPLPDRRSARTRTTSRRAVLPP